MQIDYSPGFRMLEEQSHNYDPHAARVGEILNEFLDRRAGRAALGERELLAAHPDIANELRTALEVLGDLGTLPDKINTLIKLGALTAAADPQYAAQLNSYKIIDQIGRGGMGIVLRAYEPELDRLVAIKFLKPELADDPDCRRRFTREAKTAARLKHPNIVEIHAVGESAGVPYLVMEHIDGPSLAEAIKNSQPCVTGLQPVDKAAAGTTTVALPSRDSAASAPGSVVSDPRVERSPKHVASDPRVGRSPEQASGSRQTTCRIDFQSVESPVNIKNPAVIRRIFRRLLEALAAVHDAGLIHRDVKSSNILLSLDSTTTKSPITTVRHESEPRLRPKAAVPHRSEPRTPNPEPLIRVKLTDFGLVRILGTQTAMTAADSVLGTPEYMSPEQARGDADIDHRSDLYSAGVVLYEMLTGRTPFKADTPTGVIQQILNVEPSDPRTIEKDADPVLASIALRLMAKERGDRLPAARDVIARTDENKPVRPIGDWRWTRRRALQCLIAVTAAVGISRFIPQLLRPRRIVNVRVGERATQDDNPCTVDVLSDGEVDWELFARFDKPPGIVNCVALVELDNSGTQLVIVGVELPSEGKNLIALDIDRKREWSTHLGPTERYAWPDSPVSAKWICMDVAPITLPGDEHRQSLLVICKDANNNPARLSLVDPQEGKEDPNSVFWHAGHIEGATVEPDFFGPGHPAVFAWGQNNKLDGFEDGLLLGEHKWSHWERVPCFMILDPLRMNGQGPPRTKRIDIPPAYLHAYALLDRAGESGSLYRPDEGDHRKEEDIATPSEAVGIMFTEQSLDAPRTLSAWTRSISIFDGDGIGQGSLIVDHRLSLVDYHSNIRAKYDLKYWLQYWHVIIREGMNIGQGAGSSSD